MTKDPARLYRVLVDAKAWEAASSRNYLGQGASSRYLAYSKERGWHPRPFYTVSETQVAQIRAKYGEFVAVSFIDLDGAEWTPA